MTAQPLVSVIVPTKNSERFLDACLASIRTQTYPAIELIVVDNHSTDGTAEIAGRYTDKVFSQGPERSAQRNYGASVATGRFLLFADCDMELTPEVVSACVALAESDAAVKGIIIPEESFGEGFWAQCKRLEKSFYVGVDWMEAARFYDAGVFRSVGGYSETMVSGEDWDLSHRVKDTYGAGRISEMIRHNEGRISLLETVRTKFYYAQRFSRYMQSHAKRQEATRQTGVLERFGLFFRHPGQLFRNPFVGVGMLFMKGCEFGFGAVGYVLRNWRAA